MWINVHGFRGLFKLLGANADVLSHPLAGEARLSQEVDHCRKVDNSLPGQHHASLHALAPIVELIVGVVVLHVDGADARHVGTAYFERVSRRRHLSSSAVTSRQPGEIRS